MQVPVMHDCTFIIIFMKTCRILQFKRIQNASMYVCFVHMHVAYVHVK